MNKRYKVLVAVVAAISFLASCGDKLEIEPNDNVDADKALTTSNDVESLLVGAYSALGDPDVLGGDMQRDSELLGDDGEVFWDGTFVAPGEIYTKKMLITNDQAETTWLDCYATINIANTVLKNLSLVADARKVRVEAEARFVRGLVYFELVKVYARTWGDSHGTPATNPGVPLVTEATDLNNATKNYPRNSVAEVYSLVLSDLTFAAEKLPEVNGFFATKFSAFAVLSRVYLMQADYAKARNMADSVISRGSYSLVANFADAFNKTSTTSASRSSNTNATPEDVFALQITAQDGTNDLNTFFASADFGGRGDIYVEPAHLDLYEPGDTRRDMIYDESYTSKWNNIAGNVNFIRLAEMYLTRAETNFRLGGEQGNTPITDINIIRARAGLEPRSLLSLNDILLERRLELAFEGQQIHDMKRTKRDIGDKEFDDPFLIFPIPQRERLINSALEQNDAYVQK
jgi:hypothetical protein